MERCCEGQHKLSEPLCIQRQRLLKCNADAMQMDARMCAWLQGMLADGMSVMRRQRMQAVCRPTCSACSIGAIAFAQDLPGIAVGHAQLRATCTG